MTLITKTKFGSLLLVCSSLFLGGCATLQFGKTRVASQYIDETKKSSTLIILHGAGGYRDALPWVDYAKEHKINGIALDYLSLRGYTDIIDKNAPINVDDVIKDVGEYADYISRQEWSNGSISVIGFSFGGGLVISMTDISNLENRSGRNMDYIKKIKNLIAVYPFCGLGMPSDKTNVNVQMHFGTNDWWTHESYCMLDKINTKNYKIFRYENARHGWDIKYSKSERISYDESATKRLVKNVFSNLD